MQDIAIIGNGPSRKHFLRFDKHLWNARVGCNFPEFDVDYSVYVDTSSVRLLRPQALQHHRLGSFKVVLGERAYEGLKTCKEKPGGKRTCLEWLLDEGVVEERVEYYSLIQDQRYFSSGHLAFLWASSRYPEANFHLFGFDSVLNGDGNTSTSNIEVRQFESESYTPNSAEASRAVEYWIKNWQRLFEITNFKEVIFYGGESLPDFGEKNVKAVH